LSVSNGVQPNGRSEQILPPLRRRARDVLNHDSGVRHSTAVDGVYAHLLVYVVSQGERIP